MPIPTTNAWILSVKWCVKGCMCTVRVGLDRRPATDGSQFLEPHLTSSSTRYGASRSNLVGCLLIFRSLVLLTNTTTLSCLYHTETIFNAGESDIRNANRKRQIDSGSHQTSQLSSTLTYHHWKASNGLAEPHATTYIVPSTGNRIAHVHIIIPDVPKPRRRTS